MKVEIFSRRNLLGRKLWYFRVRAGNGEPIAQSEGYSRKVDAIGTAHLLQNGLPKAEIPTVRDEGDML